MISIIIPVYNGAKTILKTLQSIEKQSYQNFEVIIVNDGSKDNIASVFESFSKVNKLERNYYFITQSNKGAPNARNQGVKKAQGDFLFFCDDDAVLQPEALEKMILALKNNPTSAYAYSSFYWGKKLFKLWPFNPEKLKKMPYIHTMSLMRREAFPASGWDEKIKKMQDWDLWLTMLANGQTGIFINEPLFKIRPGGDISSWLPAWSYNFLPFLPAVKRYKKASLIIKNKHKLV
ncbi:MAG: glycosyltransferase family A protein [Patescibacteria group bacterium]|jgi:glycosyltransferase involved in cell wall biosynthesis